jgi:hypothetical protein
MPPSAISRSMACIIGFLHFHIAEE